MDCILHEIAESRTRLSHFHFTSPVFSYTDISKLCLSIHLLMNMQVASMVLAVVNNAAVNMAI